MPKKNITNTEDVMKLYYSIDRPTLEYIGLQFGVTRQRIEQIVKIFGKRAPRPKKEKLTHKEKRIQKFFSLSEKKSNGCIEWAGRRNKKTGYGLFGFSGEGTAHRVAWVIKNGDIPDGMCILHRCDNPPCVNTDHLRLGTQADNVKDREDRWRGIKASDRPKTNIPRGRRVYKESGA